MNEPHRAASDRYASVRFHSAAPVEQRLELVDGAKVAAERVADSLRQRAFDEGHRAAATGRALLVELMSSLRADADPVFANTVARLYVYMHGQLSRAVIQNMPAAADEVVRLLSQERRAWESRRDASRPNTAASPTNAVA